MDSILIRKTAADFVSDNTFLTAGQIGQETDTGLMKQGIGNWNDLDYSTPSPNAFEQVLSGLKKKVPSSYAVKQAIDGIPPPSTPGLTPVLVASNNGGGNYIYNIPSIADASAHISWDVVNRRVVRASTNLSADFEIGGLYKADGATKSLDWELLNLNGNWTAVTQSPADNSTRIATTAYADAISALCLKIANNLSDLANAATARTNLGVAIGTNVQAYDATLQSISALGTAADKMIYTTGVDTWAEAAITSTARSLLDDASTSAMRTTLGLAIGSDVQAYNATLASLAGLTLAQGDILYASAAATLTNLAKATGTKYLNNSGTSNNPAWAQPATTDLSDYLSDTDWSGSIGFTGFSVNPTLTSVTYGKAGKIGWINFVWATNGTSNATTFTITGLPITPAYLQVIPVAIVDNSVIQTVMGRAAFTAGSTTLTFGKDLTANGGFNGAGTGGKRTQSGNIIFAIQ